MSLAAYLLLLLLGCAGDAVAEISPCPKSAAPPGPATNCTKQITFFNNSLYHTLFPVIEVTYHAAGDDWLKALDPLNNPEYTYPTTKLYRAYVNPAKGIPPKAGVTITIPWYSQLAPKPKSPDRYIDWFNGGRVYLIDNPKVLTAFHRTEHNLVSGYSGSLTCIPAPASCDQPSLPIYSDDPANGIADDLPNQNVEYTFVNVLTPANQRPRIGDYNVDYDISYVDTLYLPVALEPINSPQTSAISERTNQ